MQFETKYYTKQHNGSDLLSIILRIIGSNVALNIVKWGGLLMFIGVGIYILLAINGYKPVLNLNGHRQRIESPTQILTYSTIPNTPTIDLKEAGVLHIRSIPPQLDIYLNDRLVGPSGNRIIGRVYPNIPVGHYLLKAYKDGFFEYTRPIVVRQERVINLFIRLVKRPEWIKVNLMDKLKDYLAQNTPVATNDHLLVMQNQSFILDAIKVKDGVLIFRAKIDRFVPGRLNPFVQVKELYIPTISRVNLSYNHNGIAVLQLYTIDDTFASLLIVTPHKALLIPEEFVNNLANKYGIVLNSLISSATGLYLTDDLGLLYIVVAPNTAVNKNTNSSASEYELYVFEIEAKRDSAVFKGTLDTYLSQLRPLGRITLRNSVLTIDKNKLVVLSYNTLSTNRNPKPTNPSATSNSPKSIPHFIVSADSTETPDISPTASPLPQTSIKPSATARGDTTLQDQKLYVYALSVSQEAHKQEVTTKLTKETELDLSELKQETFEKLTRIKQATILQTSILDNPKAIAFNTPDTTYLIGELIPKDKDFELNTINRNHPPAGKLYYGKKYQVLVLPFKCKDTYSMLLSNYTIYCLDESKRMHLFRYNRVLNDILHNMGDFVFCKGRTIPQYWHIHDNYLISLDLQRGNIRVCASWDTKDVVIPMQQGYQYFLLDTVIFRLNTKDFTLEHSNLFWR